jgi:3'-5' exoribonuclease
LHFADDLDAKMNSLTRILSDSKAGDEAWTTYQPLFERFFFRGFPAPAQAKTAIEPESGKDRGVQLRLWSSGGSQDDKS